MDPTLLRESVRRGLFRVVSLFDSAATEQESAVALRARYEKALPRLSQQGVAKQLGLSKGDLEQHFSKLLREAVSEGTATRGGTAESIAQLRLLIWIERILRLKDPSGPPVLLETQPPNELAKKQVRAMELALRAFISERYGRQDLLIERLKVLFRSEMVTGWLAKAEPGNVLTGTLFRELAEIFTHQAEWPRYQALYDDGIVLFMKDRRATIRTFLEDVGSIRNTVAHHKELTAAQVELLNLYYTELADPIQRLFREGQTSVNPAALLDADHGVVERYFLSLREDVQRIEGRTVGVERNLQTVQGDVADIGDRTRRTHMSVGLIGVLLTLAAVSVIYVILRARSELAQDYRSLGWLTLATGQPREKAASLLVQGQVWMGNQDVSFGNTDLRMVAERGGTVEARAILTGKLNPRQVGDQEAIEFDVPSGADTLTTCFSVPSAKLGGLYTVMQRFALPSGPEGMELAPLGAAQVVPVDRSYCRGK